MALDTVSLAQAPTGRSLRIVGIDGGRMVRRRLTAMGLREGGEIRLVRAIRGGPAEIEIGAARLMLGAGMSAKIRVADTLAHGAAAAETNAPPAPRLTLRDLKVGDHGRVLDFVPGGSPAYRRRLLAFGVTRGEAFRVERVAPLGDPVEIVLRGFSLSLRRDEAEAVLVEKEPDATRPPGVRR